MAVLVRHDLVDLAPPDGQLAGRLTQLLTALGQVFGHTCEIHFSFSFALLTLAVLGLHLLNALFEPLDPAIGLSGVLDVQLVLQVGHGDLHLDHLFAL